MKALFEVALRHFCCRHFVGSQRANETATLLYVRSKGFQLGQLLQLARGKEVTVVGFSVSNLALDFSLCRRKDS